MAILGFGTGAIIGAIVYFIGCIIYTLYLKHRKSKKDETIEADEQH